jgi:hypothetical protein
MWGYKQYYIGFRRFMSKQMAKVPRRCLAFVSMNDGEPVPQGFSFLEGPVGPSIEAKESRRKISGKRLGPTN